MKRVLIRVTKKHIAEKNHSARSCPVALAISEVVRNEVSVVRRTVVFYGFPNPSGLGSLYSILSTRVTRWINRYDNRKPVKPFNFYLQVPETLTHAPS